MSWNKTVSSLEMPMKIYKADPVDTADILEEGFLPSTL